MPSHSIFGYAPGAIVHHADGRTFGLRPDYDPMTDRVRVDIFGETDTDAEKASREVVIWGLDGAVRAAGDLHLEPVQDLSHPDGHDIGVLHIAIADRLAAHLTTEPLEPGIRFGVDTTAASPVPAISGRRRADRPALSAGTRIATGRGDVPVQWLRPGDLIRTRENGLQPVIWVGRCDMPARDLVWIASGALGQGAPARPLVLAVGQRIALGGAALPLLYSLPGAFVPAGGLRHWPGIATVGQGLHDGIQFLLPCQCQIRVEGVWLEHPMPGSASMEEWRDILSPWPPSRLVPEAFTPTLPRLSLTEARAIPPEPMPPKRARGSGRDLEGW